MERKKINLGLFILALICFLLPFTTVSCGGEKIARLSGLNVAFGSRIEGQRYGGSVLAIFILLLIICGIALYFWNDAKEIFATALVGILGTFFMLILGGGMNGKVKKMSDGLASSKLNLGYYLVLILFIAVAAYQVYIIYGGVASQSSLSDNKK